MEYNTLIEQFGSSTTLLNDLHRQVISKLQNQTPQSATKTIISIVDKFPGCSVGDYIITHAETHSVAVAAASIIARKKGLDQIKELSAKVGFSLPLGSTHVEGALQRLIKQGSPVGEFCKLHFSNVKKALSNRL